MKKLCLCLVIACSTSMWSQSVADAARAAREQKKTSAPKTITNDDLDASPQAIAESNWNRDLHRVEKVLSDICADPRTNDGRELSDKDKQAVEAAVEPLGVRRTAQEQKLKEWKEALTKLDGEQDAAISAAIPRDRAFTDEDRQHIAGIREEFNNRRKSTAADAEVDEKAYQSMMKEIVKLAEACPEAAKMVQ